MKFAIDLTWMRHKIVGGAETYIYNILVGFSLLEKDFDILLVTASDNYEIYKHFENDKRFNVAPAKVKSMSVFKRILWQNFKLSKFIRKKGYSVCFVPIPFVSFFGNKIKYISVIHDLQMKHYPQFHSKKNILWYSMNWKNAIKKSEKIITISNFCKDDICKNFKVDSSKIQTIYNAIDFKKLEYDQNSILSKFGIVPYKYFFTISKLNKHKNLSTVLDVFSKIVNNKIDSIPNVLVISGVNGSMKEELFEKISLLSLGNNVVLTGFVSDEEKQCLYHNAYAFLFPSVFEGFGMPLIEAMHEGAMTITTSETCIPEVTQYKANYVKNAYSLDEWIDVILHSVNNSDEVNFSIYDSKYVANKYFEVINDVYKNRGNE